MGGRVIHRVVPPQTLHAPDVHARMNKETIQAQGKAGEELGLVGGVVGVYSNPCGEAAGYD
jgi:hypothetical protein